MPLVKAFMNDTTILLSKESTARKILSLMKEQIIWYRMKSLRKEKVNQNIRFKVSGQRIPAVSEELVKGLGRWFDGFLKDINQAKKTSRTLQEGLHKSYRCPL